MTTDKPKTCGECASRFRDGSCKAHRHITTKPGAKACKDGTKAETGHSEQGEQESMW